MAALVVVSEISFSTMTMAQNYDVNAIQQELAQLRQRFNNCTNSFGQGMNQNFETYLQGGGYGTTEMGQGCDMNTLAAINARAYQLELMLARSNGDDRPSCEVQWMPGCPQPGQ